MNICDLACSKIFAILLQPLFHITTSNVWYYLWISDRQLDRKYSAFARQFCLAVCFTVASVSGGVCLIVCSLSWRTITRPMRSSVISKLCLTEWLTCSLMPVALYYSLPAARDRTSTCTGCWPTAAAQSTQVYSICTCCTEVKPWHRSVDVCWELTAYCNHHTYLLLPTTGRLIKWKGGRVDVGRGRVDVGRGR